MIIHLHQLYFYGKHGLYEEEKIAGGTFILNIDIHLSEADKRIVSIRETIDYVAIYGLIKERMKVPSPLLETLAYDIAEIILSTSKLVEKVSVNIVKKTAPIINFEGEIGVTIVKNKFSTLKIE